MILGYNISGHIIVADISHRYFISRDEWEDGWKLEVVVVWRNHTDRGGPCNWYNESHSFYPPRSVVVVRRNHQVRSHLSTNLHDLTASQLRMKRTTLFQCVFFLMRFAQYNSSSLTLRDIWPLEAYKQLRPPATPDTGAGGRPLPGPTLSTKCDWRGAEVYQYNTGQARHSCPPKLYAQWSKSPASKTKAMKRSH